MWNNIFHLSLRFHLALSDYLWKYAFGVIPVTWEKTILRLLCCCTSCENLVWHKANLTFIEAGRFMDLSEWFSMNVRDVHRIKFFSLCSEGGSGFLLCHFTSIKLVLIQMAPLTLMQVLSSGAFLWCVFLPGISTREVEHPSISI